jgi:hypothetical protein
MITDWPPIRASVRSEMNLPTYITQLADALQAENGPNLAYLLRPTSPHGKDLVKEFRNPTVHALPNSLRFCAYHSPGRRLACVARVL